MSQQTPTTKEVNDNIIAQLEASLNQSIPLLPKSFLRVLAKVIAGVFMLLYKYAGWASLQMFVRTASDQVTEVNGISLIPLVEWGRLIGIGDPVSATNAELNITVTVENQTGTLPSGTQLIGAKNGVTYITIGSVSLTASTVTARVRAVSDQVGGGGAGVIGNLNVADVMSFANPLANVARDTTVSSILITAADAETTEAYRQRVEDRFKNKPQGGAYADYRQWGEETAGIIHIYPYTSVNPGQVDVYCEATVASSGNPDGIPTSAQLQAVEDIINYDVSALATRRPAGALVTAFAITRVTFDIVISGLSAPNLADTKTAIEAALSEYFTNREPFIYGLDIPPRNDSISKTTVAGNVDDIVQAANGVFIDAFVYNAGNSVSIYTLQEGEKAKLGTVTYI